MTKNLRALLRVQLMMAWRGWRGNLTGRSKWGMVLLPVLALSFLPLIIMVSGLYAGLYFGGKALGEGQVVLTMALTAGQVVCLTFGVFYLMSAFYFAKDLHLLLPLPLRPSEIVLSKFISIMVGEYLTMMPVLGPALVVYGVFADVSWNYIPFALIIYLLLPVIPLVVGSLFTIVLMRVTNLRRNRDLYRVLGALLGVAIAFGFNMISRLGSQNGSFAPSAQQMQQVIEQQRALFAAAGRWFPTSQWATGALREGAAAFGFSPFLLFAAVALAALFVMLFVAEKLFFGGAVGGDESRSSGKKLTRAELEKETGVVRTPLWALLQREFRLLNRTPSFLMAGVMPLIMMPFFVILPMLQDKQMGAELLPKVAQFADSPLIPAIAVGALLFANSMSNVAATAVSREGRFFWISRSMPVAPRIQVQAKLLHSLFFTGLNLLLILAALAYLRVLTPLNLLYVLVGGVLASIATSYAGLFVDLMRPNLKWTDPQQAMKGNYNVLFGLLFIWLTLGVFAALAALMFAFVPNLLMPIVIVLFAVEAAVFHKVTGAFADKRYSEIEDD
jgi:ABC-2 type transport system permease protein